LAIEEHIDPNFFIKREDVNEPGKRKPAKKIGRYDDLWNLGMKEEEEEHTDEERPRGERLPEKDLVYYIMRNSPSLKEWQRDAMAMVHEEMEYFVPQMQTKTLNEGWACATGESLLVTEKGFIRFDELYEKDQKIFVAGSGFAEIYPITDFHKEVRVETIRIR